MLWSWRGKHRWRNQVRIQMNLVKSLVQNSVHRGIMTGGATWLKAECRSGGGYSSRCHRWDESSVRSVGGAHEYLAACGVIKGRVASTMASSLPCDTGRARSFRAAAIHRPDVHWSRWTKRSPTGRMELFPTIPDSTTPTPCHGWCLDSGFSSTCRILVKNPSHPFTMWLITIQK